MDLVGESLQLPGNAVPGPATRLRTDAAPTTAPAFVLLADSFESSSSSSSYSSSSSGDGASEVTAPTLRKLTDASSSSSGSLDADVGDTIRLPPPSSGSLDDWSPPPGFWGSDIGDANESVRSPPSTPTPTPMPTEATNNAATVGIAAAVVVTIVCVVVFLIRRRKKRQRKEPVETNTDMYVDLLISANKPGDAPTPMPATHTSQATTATADAASTVEKSTSRTTSSTIATRPDDFSTPLLVTVRIPFDDLQIGDVISQGGFGEVAYGTYRNQDVAIKRLLASRRRNPKSVASFVQEIELNATLDHECLVSFLGAAWDARENLCMVSEFMHGGDLRTLLNGYAQSGHPNGHDGGKMRTAVQVAQALAYLHRLDPPVVHRDLKSRNVLLTSEMDAKLIDFGVSTECHDETMTAGVGTSLWMAPEIMLGKRYDEKADIFSFGVILSELDTHEIPYDHARDPRSNRKLASAVLHRLIYEGRLKPRFTELADPEIVALARDCLEVDPSKRPTATQVLDRTRRSRQQGGRMPGGGSGTGSGSQATSRFAMETRATTQQGHPTSPFDTRTRMDDTEF